MKNHPIPSEKPKRSLAMISALAIAALAPVAHAHHPMGGMTPATFTEGMLSGIGHPVIGIDHLAFLVVAALLSFTLRGNARYLVPVAFIAATVVGTLIHLGAADLPMSETVIALSALLGGLAVMFKGSLPALLLGSLFAVFGIYHGYAYGEAIVGAEQTPLLSYLLGFAMTQYAIIAGGVALLSALAARSARMQSLAVRSGAWFATVTGAVFLGLGLA
jgi:urease accessory protein